MKRSLILTAAIGFFLGAALLLPLTSSAATWNEAYRIGSGGSRPAIAIDSQGNLHTVWWEPTTQVIQYSTCASLDASTCSAPETLPNNGSPSYNPSIALDPQDRPNVVWEAQDGDSSAIFWSRRANDAWGAAQKISTQANSTRADIAIGPQGMVHVVYQSSAKTNRAVNYVESNNDFATMTRAEIGAHELTADAAQQPDAVAADSQKLAGGLNARVTVDHNDRAHVVWNAPAPFGIFYRIQVGANVFAKPIEVATGNREQAPDIAYARSGTVGIVWSKADNNNLGFAEYKDGARIFKANNVDGGLARSLAPRIAADCSGNYLLAYQGKLAGEENWNIFVRTFTPATKQFDTRLTIGNARSEQTTPDIAALDRGAVLFHNADYLSTMLTTSDLGVTCIAPITPTPTSTDIEHVRPDDARLVLNGNWVLYANDRAPDDIFRRCGGNKVCKKGWTAELNFNGGTRVDWHTAYANKYGKVHVLIDGVAYEEADLCKLNKDSAQPKFASRSYVLFGDANTPHSIQIKAMGHTICSPDDVNQVPLAGFTIYR